MELGFFDVVKILGYGLSGFSFLLVMLAFMLLRKEQDKPEPRKMIIQTIQMFMGLCLIMCIAVGLISIPISGHNTQLQDAVVKVKSVNQNSQSTESAVDKLASAAMNDKLGASDVEMASQVIGKSLDSIQNTVLQGDGEPVDDQTKADLVKTRTLVNNDLASLKKTDQNPDSVQATLRRIQVNTRRIKDIGIRSVGVE